MWLVILAFSIARVDREGSFNWRWGAVGMEWRVEKEEKKKKKGNQKKNKKGQKMSFKLASKINKSVIKICQTILLT